MPGKYILIAEDNPNDVELTLAALKEHKLSIPVEVVNDGAAALDFLYKRGAYAGRTQGDPTVILLDLKMPKVDGLEVLRTIKKDANLRLIPVVMLTSSREEADLTRSYESGVNAYVVKPVDFEEFMKTVHDLGLFWALVNEPSPHPGTGQDNPPAKT